MRYLLLTSLLAVLPLHAAEKLLRIENAWVREAPPGVTVLGAYLRLCNDSEATITLVDVKSEQFGKVEIHETVESNGETRMQHLESLAIATGTCTEFAPGGKHLMLFDPVKPLRDGDFVMLQFHFASTDTLNQRLPVRRGDNKQEYHHHVH